MPLESVCHVWLTRPAGRNEALAGRLASAGLVPLVLPALQLTPLPLGSSDFPAPSSYQLIMFVSGFAAQCYFSLFRQFQHHWPDATLAASVGQASARQVLDSRCVPAANVVWPESTVGAGDSEALLRCLGPQLAALRRVLIVRGEQGRNWLADQLRSQGIRVDTLAVYRREPAGWSAADVQRWREWAQPGAPRVVLITSIESLEAMVRLAHAHDPASAWLRSRFVVVHARIAERLGAIVQAAGFPDPPVVKLSTPSDDALFRTIIDVASVRPPS